MAKYTLMQHQNEAVKFLDRVDGIGALLMDPGTGKTGSTLTWIDRLTAQYGEVRVLVVAPLTAADTWVLQVPYFMDSVVKSRMLQGSTLSILAMIRQSAQWYDVPTTKIMVNHKGTKRAAVSGNKVTILSMSAGAISSFAGDNAKRVQVLQAVRKYAPHVVVVDESHIIKSANGNLSKAMYQIGQLAPHRIILTGTVNPHSMSDCYGQWRFLAPWTFSDQYGEPYTLDPLNMSRTEAAGIRPWSWGRFRDRYTISGGYKGKGIGGFQREGDLRNRVAERAFVVKKEDALDLPPTRDVDIHITLSPKEAKAYKDMAEQLVVEIESGEYVEAVNPLAKYMKLRQITAGLVRDTETDEVHVLGNTKRKAIKEVCETQLAAEDRIVVFAYFRTECALIADSLKSKGTEVVMITGDTKAAERLAIRAKFGDVSANPQRMILVAQARTMSISVNELVTAQHAVFASLSERSNDWSQSRDRLDRIGQTKPVTFWNVLAPDSVDTIMLESHKDRGDMENRLLNHIKAVAASR